MSASRVVLFEKIVYRRRNGKEIELGLSFDRVNKKREENCGLSRPGKPHPRPVGKVLP